MKYGKMIKKLKVLLVIIPLFIITFLSLSAADMIYMKDGAKINGKFLEMDKESTIIDAGLGGPLFLASWEIDHIEYINDDLGIKISCPPGWHMYVGKNLEKIYPLRNKEIPIVAMAVSFFKYPYGTKNNSTIALEIQDIHFSKETFTGPGEMINATILHMKTATKNFNLIVPPQKVMVNGVEGIKYITEFFGLSEEKDDKSSSRQIIYNFAKGSMSVQIISSVSSHEFTQDKSTIERCMDSFNFSGEMPGPSESNLYKALAFGTIYYAKENELGYGLLLQTKKPLFKGSYIEVEFTNPLVSNQPIVVFKAISESLPENERIDFSSTPVKGIEPFKEYRATIRTYKTKDKKELIDTLSQKMISFMRSPEKH